MNKKCICAAVAVMLSASAAAARTPVMENAEMFRAVPEQNVVDRPLQLPNPIKEHTSIAAVAKAVGFMPLTLRHNGHYTLTACETIEKTAQLVYRESDVKNNNRLMIRTTLRRKTDARSLSGYYADWMPVVVSRTAVSVTTGNGINYAAYWRNGMYSYSVSMTETTAPAFMEILVPLVAQTEAGRTF